MPLFWITAGACGADTPFSRLTQLQAVCSLYGLGFQSGWVVESAAESDRYVDAPEYLSPVVAADYEITGRILLPRASALITPALRPGVTVTPLLTDLVTDMADIDQTASLDAGVKRLPAQRITFDSESSRQRVTILALTLIPGVLLLTMAVVLLKRRRL